MAKSAIKYYPTEDEVKYKRRTKTKSTVPQKNFIKLKKSLSPGTVLILLAGRYQGKRVVFLKQLDSGLLLVTGPYKVNGVPLRRVNQAYTISTTQKVDIEGLQIPDEVNDSYFTPKKSAKATTDSAKSREFFQQGAVFKYDPEITKKKKAVQDKVDDAIMSNIEEVAFLKEYLKDKFFLRRGEAPHKMAF
eukprot:snap_masked-scaffold_5-processed-gene-11.24-mRNA-1 protein AED:0.19 eAED:0.19 QI:0/-1/0/1/-1/1/1/0/189